MIVITIIALLAGLTLQGYTYAMRGSKRRVTETTIVAIQGIHVIEHVIQLAQVFVFGVADDDAFGLLGYVFNFQGTEEWLHLVFNAWYLFALLLRLPVRAIAVFIVLGLGLETWHVVEHAVIIGNVIQNDGCPCPGIGDRALGISDTILHFGYNAVAFAGTFLTPEGQAQSRPTTETSGPGLMKPGMVQPSRSYSDMQVSANPSRKPVRPLMSATIRFSNLICSLLPA